MKKVSFKTRALSPRSKNPILQAGASHPIDRDALSRSPDVDDDATLAARDPVVIEPACLPWCKRLRRTRGRSSEQKRERESEGEGGAKEEERQRERSMVGLSLRAGDDVTRNRSKLEIPATFLLVLRKYKSSRAIFLSWRIIGACILMHSAVARGRALPRSRIPQGNSRAHVSCLPWRGFADCFDYFIITPCKWGRARARVRIRVRATPMER